MMHSGVEHSFMTVLFCSEGDLVSRTKRWRGRMGHPNVMGPQFKSVDWPCPLASAPNAPFCAYHRKRRRGIFIEARGLFLPNRDKLGPLPLPNGDSIEPRESSSEFAAYGDPQPPWTLNTRTSTAFFVTGSFFSCSDRWREI
jgi:hypothetical protein